MRALTVRQPWAWAIIHGGKDVENRSRNLAGAYRGPVAIHAGLAPFEKDNDGSRAHKAAYGSEVPTALVFGALIGVVDLVGVHESPDEGCMGLDPFDRARLCSPWAQQDVWHLVLANPRPLPEPVPYRGRLGLWTLPDGAVDLEAVAS
ncbi:ASCH domain-containing protein [Georgenia wangjunii]|uniref:ASCH domain-containing protein n=1 Tax=Georgenia wangjunii TaxID=3117730 RepID=UPI002F26CEC1